MQRLNLIVHSSIKISNPSSFHGGVFLYSLNLRSKHNSNMYINAIINYFTMNIIPIVLGK